MPCDVDLSISGSDGDASKSVAPSNKSNAQTPAVTPKADDLSAFALDIDHCQIPPLGHTYVLIVFSPQALQV